MSTNNLFKSDLPYLHNVVQNTMISAPKEIIIATLRDYFSHDTYYHFDKDAWGFANTVDHTDLPLGSGLNDHSTTRLFIGEYNRRDPIYYPAILVKHGGGRSVPISLNREDSTVSWDVILYEDGYGNSVYRKIPKSFVFAGAWEGSISIDVITRSLHSRDELLQEIMMCFTDITNKALERVGIAVKPNASWSAPSDQEDRNDKLFRQTITLEIRTEWRREIPVRNIVEVINFSVEFGYLSSPNAPIAQNLTINTNVTLLDIMAGEVVPIQA